MNLKRLKKTTLLFLAFNLLSTSLSAEEGATHSDLKNSLPSDCVFSGDFKQSKKIKALPQPLLSSGRLFFSCGQGLIWHNETPFLESLIYTKENLHFRDLPHTEPEILNGQQHYYLAKFLIDLLSANTKQIEKDFLIDARKTESNTSIELTPNNQFIKKGLKSITIKKTTEEEKENLSITIINANEQIIALTITNLSAYTENQNSHCTAIFTNKSSCAILATPQHYQITDSN